MMVVSRRSYGRRYAGECLVEMSKCHPEDELLYVSLIMIVDADNGPEAN